ncbi:MAG TPA: triose-phosphate isomerase [Stellaceae bacterium]|nr:triose-phosphate isomerase [Stellaceae bacterium]
MRKLIAGNWKMNGLKAGGVALAKELVRRAAAGSPGPDLLLCPPATLLSVVAEAIAGSILWLGGQDCHTRQRGAHTGDISAAMLKDAGCSHVILGHSERRTDHHESDALIRAKVKAAREAGLVTILCVGETAQERDAGRCLDIVSRQIAGSLPEGLSAAELVIAYEPIWAIGTGRTPTPAEIADVHAHLRAALAGRVTGAASVRLLYGGSVKPNNAWELLRIANVDGALVGGASLDAADFWAIAEAAD